MCVCATVVWDTNNIIKVVEERCVCARRATALSLSHPSTAGGATKVFHIKVQLLAQPDISWLAELTNTTHNGIQGKSLPPQQQQQQRHTLDLLVRKTRRRAAFETERKLLGQSDLKFESRLTIDTRACVSKNNCFSIDCKHMLNL